MKVALFCQLAAFLLAQAAHAAVRTVVLKNDELLTVKTALGIATIVEVPTPVQSPIIGDQSAFRIEYLDRAVVIKPLRYGAKTNLYLMTKTRRFNLRLVTLSQDVADYVVYIREPGQPALPKWSPLFLSKARKKATLVLTRASLTPQGYVLIEGRLSTKTSFSVKPEHLWVRQGNESKIIHHLYLSDKMAGKDRPVLIGIAVHQTDLREKAPVVVEIRAQETLSLTVPGAAIWR